MNIDSVAINNTSDDDASRNSLRIVKLFPSQGLPAQAPEATADADKSPTILSANTPFEMTTEMARHSVVLHRIGNKLGLSNLSEFDPNTLLHSIAFTKNNGTYEKEKNHLAKRSMKNAATLDYTTFDERDIDLEKLEKVLGKEIEDSTEPYSTEGLTNIHLQEHAKLKNRIKAKFDFFDNEEMIDSSFFDLTNRLTTHAMQTNFENSVAQRKQDFKNLFNL